MRRAGPVSPELATPLGGRPPVAGRALAKLPPDLRAAALAEGLRAAAADERCALAAALIEVAALESGERGRPALAQIARLWEMLPSDAQYAALAVGGERWTDLCRDLLEDADPAARRRALLLIGRCGLVGLAEGVVDRLLSGEAAAEETLVALARGCDDADGAARRTVEAAVARAAAAYPDHRRKGVLLALAALMESPGARRGPIGRLLEESSGPIAMALRGLIRRDEDRCFAGLALVWLTHPALEAACRDRLARMDGADAARIGRLAHLAGHPRREEKLRGALAGANGATVAGGLIAGASADGRRGLMRIAGTMNAAARAGFVGTVIADASPAVRLAAVRTAALSGDEAGAACLADLSFDADERIARAAATALLASPAMRESSSARRTLAHLERSAHAGVRATASRFAAAMRLGEGESAGGRLRARRAMVEDRGAFLDRLRAKIKAGATAERVGAVQLARRLGVCRDVELELLAALGEVDGAAGQAAEARGGESTKPEPAHLAATAITALQQVASGASDAAVRACLGHPDPRVRANAVEGAACVGGPLRDAAAWAKLLGDGHHRVRGAAVIAAMRQAVGPGVVRDPELAAAAGATISGMLAHEDASVRISGLWCLGRVAGRSPDVATALAARVEDLSRTDEDERVRVRAAALSARLLRSMRAGWTARAWEGIATTVQDAESPHGGHAPTSRGDRNSKLHVAVRARRGATARPT